MSFASGSSKNGKNLDPDVRGESSKSSSLRLKIRNLFKKEEKLSPSPNPAVTPARTPSPLARDVDQQLGGSSKSLASTDRSLWERAYEGLGKAGEEQAELIKKYEALLAKNAAEAEAGSAPNAGSSNNDAPSRDTGGSRQAQLDVVIESGLQRLKEKKNTVESGIAQAAELVLSVKDWIDQAIEASPQASLVWAGVCLVLPLLTNPAAATEANRNGFVYVTTRMRFFTALEPMVRRLGHSFAVIGAVGQRKVMGEVEVQIVELYGQILDFQIRSVLRFAGNRIKEYSRDVFSAVDWKGKLQQIQKLEDTAHRNLVQINDLALREEVEAVQKELENLNKTSLAARGTMEQSLSAVQRLLYVAENQLEIIKQELEIQEQRHLSDEERKCLQLFRLTSGNNNATYESYKDRTEDRVDGTCQWFLRHDNFTKWIEQPESGPLLVSADPGCGKSVLSKYLVNEVLPESASGATLCYFFFKDQDQNTSNQGLCAILHQLFSQQPHLIRHAAPQYSRNGSGLVSITAALWDILVNAIKDAEMGSVILVLDALDECKKEDMEDLVKQIPRLFHSETKGHGQVKCLITSRPYGHIMSRFNRLTESFPYIRIPGEEESDAISTEEVPHRTYLWVYLVFDHLEEEGFRKTARGVDSAIATLPKSVNEAYELILSRSKEDPMVRKVLSIVLAAARPLTLSEMNVAAALSERFDSLAPGDFEDWDDMDIYDLDLEDDKDFKSRLRSWCGLFVSIHQGRIYFLHQTVREFLLAKLDITSPPTSFSGSVPSPSRPKWHHSITMRQASATLAEVCIFYISCFLPRFDITPTRGYEYADPPEYESLHFDGGVPIFFAYAVENWPAHFCDAEISAKTITSRTTTRPNLMTLALKICAPNSRAYSLVGTRSWGSGILHRYETQPLRGAAKLGQVAFLQLLLAALDQTRPDVTDKIQIALVVAARNGKVNCVQLLLSQGAACEDTKVRNRALRQAAEEGYVAVVKLLLRHGADVDARNGGSGMAPLHYAATRAHEALMRLLLERGANIEAKDDKGRTPLAIATRNGHKALMRLLLERGANIEAKDDKGRTPLVITVEGRIEHLEDDKGQTLLSITKKKGQTPHSIIAQGLTEHFEETEMLLNRNADIETRDHKGRTPLFLAAEHGFEGVIRLLLDRNAAIETRDHNGRTPLCVATRNGLKAVMRLLLERGANIEAKDDEGQTPLSITVQDIEHFEEPEMRLNEHLEETKMLLNRNADIETRDHNGRTPLFLAAEHGFEEAVRLLLDKGANTETKDCDGQTPLAIATMMKMCREVAFKESVLRTPWTHEAFRRYRARRYRAIVQLLLKKGALQLEGVDSDDTCHGASLD